MDLRAKIAQLVLDAHRRLESPHGFEDEFQAADRILAIPEIAEALRERNGKLGLVTNYGRP